MSVNRTPELLDMIREWTDHFEDLMLRGAYTARIQWRIEGHDHPLTLLANGSGVFVVEPGAGMKPAREWAA